MGAAIFGLVGVIVGGMLTGAVSWWLERRKERREVRAAARLIGMGFREVPHYLERMKDTRTYVQPPIQVSYSYNIWAEYYRDSLASTLSVSDWNATQQGMSVVEQMLDWGVSGPPDGLASGWLAEATEQSRRAMEAWTRIANRRI